MGFLLGEYRGTKPSLLPCKVALAGNERYLVCATVAAAVVPDPIGSSSVFCNEWCVVCTYFYAVLELLVADRRGVAA